MAGKAVFFKQRIEHRLGYQVLSEHFDYLPIADAVVEVVAQLGGKGVKGNLFLSVGWVLHDALNAVDVGAGDLGDVVGPVFPVAAVAALFDDLGVDGLFDFTYFVGQLGLLGQLAFGIVFVSFLANAVLTFAGLTVAGAAGFLCLLVGLVGDGDNFHLARV
ncbi:hypothetical protein D3C84_894400 [compost metagenome]